MCPALSVPEIFSAAFTFSTRNTWPFADASHVPANFSSPDAIPRTAVSASATITRIALPIRRPPATPLQVQAPANPSFSVPRPVPHPPRGGRFLTLFVGGHSCFPVKLNCSSPDNLTMKFGVIVFPGSNCDHDAFYAVSSNLGQQAEFIWHDSHSLGDIDAVILPGGFSYGDSLRCGAIAKFSPVMQAVKKFAADGGLVLGVCNGFQILCEAVLLPGALVRNRGLKFICRELPLRAATTNSPFTNAADLTREYRMPIAHGEGCYIADERTLD